MKKIIIFLILFIPVFVYAEGCATKTYDAKSELANIITYDTTFNKTSKKYEIVFYGVNKTLYIKYGSTTYKPKDGEIKVSGIYEGTNASFKVYFNDDCGVIRTFNINLPYYNSFYGSSLCSGYEDKLTACGSEFMNFKVTKDYIERVIEKYDKTIVTDKEKTEKVEEKVTINFKEKVKELALDWGVKIALLIITTVVSILFYRKKYNKVVHGV